MVGGLARGRGVRTMILAVSLAVAPELREGQIVGIEGEESELSERTGEHFGQALLVILRIRFQDGHELSRRPPRASGYQAA